VVGVYLFDEGHGGGLMLEAPSEPLCDFVIVPQEVECKREADEET